ncbi:MAG: hypothetical protein ACOYM3_03705 [Terrimicrobiaceae bacterium]
MRANAERLNLSHRRPEGPPDHRSLLLALALATFMPAMAALAQTAAGVAPAIAPSNVPVAAVDQTGAATGGNSAAIKPLNTPNVLDGLESLQLAKDPDFGPPIIDANAIYQGRPFAGTSARSSGSSGNMGALEANLATPDLNAPSFQAGIEAATLSSPNEKLPSLDILDSFGTSMGGSPLDTLASPGPSMQQRPLGTIGAPSFLATKHSIPIGNNRVRFGVSVETVAAYNNNVFGAPSKPQGDMLFALQPTLYLETGKKGTIQFLWSPSFLEYAKYKQFNSVNQTFLFSSRYRWTKLRVGLDASYLAQSGLFLNSQGQAQQKAVYARMFAGYALTKKVEVLFNLDGSVTDSSPGGKQYQGTFTTSVDYKYSQKTTVGMAIALSYFYSPTGMTTSESFLLRLLYNPTSKLVFRGEGGLQFRHSSSSTGGASAATTVVNVTAIYRPSSKTYVSLRLFRNVDMDAFNAGNQQITTSVESAASWKVFHSTTLDAALGAGRVENISMNGQELGTYNFVQANLGVSYILTDEVNVKLFNNLQQRLNDTLGNNYISNTTGMSLGLRF